MSDLRDEIGMTMLRLQNNNAQIPTIMNTMNLITQANVSSQTNPNSVVTNLLARNETTVEQLKTLSNSTGNGNLEHKVMAFVKVILQAQHVQIEEMKKQLAMTSTAMKNMGELLLMTQFGDEESGGISWTRYNKLILDIIEAKSSPPPAAPPAAPPAGPARGLGM